MNQVTPPDMGKNSAPYKFKDFLKDAYFKLNLIPYAPN